MIETIEIQIGKDTFKIQSFPATRALQVAAKLAKVVGGAGMGVNDFTLKVEELSEAYHVGNMVQGILQNIDATDDPKLIRNIVQEVLVSPNFKDVKEGENADEKFNLWYEDRFAGKQLQDLPVLLYGIFSHNYGDPMEWIKKVMAQAIDNGWLAPSAPSSTGTNSESEQAD